jgi:hypothetical protein
VPGGPVGGTVDRRQLRLDQLAASGQCCKPLPSVGGVEYDDSIGKQPPAGFDA